ncbi:hypothetical protein [Myxococcus sp. CA040A]|uniref:hypothetical protein n=1 Tax=Myxococcus sp. CA040A TaxID=2741738 RepID=UPI00157B020D|nr:hypothetical protein [Myxococcus sp. CA040A]NTX08963.1 hypothetical protein [Myxococcus sp. CA040A]
MPDGINAEVWKQCWKDVAELMKSEPRVLALSVPQVDCLRLHLLHQCGGWFVAKAKYATGRKDSKSEDFLEEYAPRGTEELNDSRLDEALLNRRYRKVCIGIGGRPRGGEGTDYDIDRGRGMAAEVDELSALLGNAGRRSHDWDADTGGPRY